MSLYFIVCLTTFVPCIFLQKNGLHNDQMRSRRVSAVYRSLLLYHSGCVIFIFNNSDAVPVIAQVLIIQDNIMLFTLTKIAMECLWTAEIIYNHLLLSFGRPECVIIACMYFKSIYTRVIGENQSSLLLCHSGSAWHHWGSHLTSLHLVAFHVNSASVLDSANGFWNFKIRMHCGASIKGWGRHGNKVISRFLWKSKITIPK